jgi:hypothetical protein
VGLVVQRAVLPDGEVSWTVLDAEGVGRRSDGPGCDNSTMTTDPASTDTSGVRPQGSRLRVREMQLTEVAIRIDYFHDPSDDHLRSLGVDRGLLPSRAAWCEFYQADYARPIRDRDNYSLLWEFDDEIVGSARPTGSASASRRSCTCTSSTRTTADLAWGRNSLGRAQPFTSKYWNFSGCTASRTRSMSPPTERCSVPAFAMCSPSKWCQVRSTFLNP